MIPIVLTYSDSNGLSDVIHDAPKSATIESASWLKYVVRED